MKNFVVRTLATVFAGAVMVSSASATIATHELKEQRRINKGEKKGQLTPRETNRLMNQQNIIDAERRQAHADGKMTHREHRDIRHDQKRLSADIYHKRHNANRVRYHKHH